MPTFVIIIDGRLDVLYVLHVFVSYLLGISWFSSTISFHKFMTILFFYAIRSLELDSNRSKNHSFLEPKLLNKYESETGT